jgi:Holliday junction resolvasome RuvABC endonuclease subunit
MSYLLSLDLSISCTGLCIFDVDKEEFIEHHIIPVKKTQKKKYISNKVLEICDPYKDSLKWVAKEGYSFGGSALSRLAEQSGVCLFQLYMKEINNLNNLITIAPVSVKKVGCGKGKATKKEVMEGVKQRWGIDTEYWYSSDDCDAFVIGYIALMTINNTPSDSYEKELRKKIIKNNKLNL